MRPAHMPTGLDYDQLLSVLDSTRNDEGPFDRMLSYSNPERAVQSRLSVVIPTYQREAVLLDSLHQLIQLKPAPDRKSVV